MRWEHFQPGRVIRKRLTPRRLAEAQYSEPVSSANNTAIAQPSDPRIATDASRAAALTNARPSSPPSPGTLVPSTPAAVRDAEARIDSDGDAVMKTNEEHATQIQDAPQTQAPVQLPASSHADHPVTAAEKTLWRQSWELTGQKGTLDDFVRRQRTLVQLRTSKLAPKRNHLAHEE